MDAAPRLSWSEVRARRLERHGLAAPLPGARPADVVATMCGAHAQVLSAGELSVGLRIAGGTRNDVRDALWSERSLVKTFGPRGTVHLLPTQDLPMWTGALSALPYDADRHAKLVQMTPGQIEEVVAAMGEALQDAELTTDELTAALAATAGPWAVEPVPAFQTTWPRWRMVVDLAAKRGALCFGHNRGRNITYTNPHRWLPGFRPADGPAALAMLVKRYLHAYGPAMPAHFARWLAAPPGWASRLFDTLAGAGELEQVEVTAEADGDGAVAGGRAWVVAGDTAAPPAPPEGLRLLPYFDAYVVGSHPRELVYPGRAAERVAGAHAGSYAVLLLGGAVAGVWHQRRSGRRLAITVEPLEPLTAAQRRQLDDEVARIGAFLEAQPTLTVGTVTVGPHA